MKCKQDLNRADKEEKDKQMSGALEKSAIL